MLRFYSTVNTIGSCKAWSVYLTTLTGQVQSSKRLTSIVHILSPKTDNCPSWTSGRERMMIENISWSNIHIRMLQTRRGRTHNLMITSQMHIQLSHWGQHIWGGKYQLFLKFGKDLYSLTFIQVASSEKSAFEHAQKVLIQIILPMHKVSSRPLLSIETFYSIQWFCPRTAKAFIRLHKCAVWSRPFLSAYAGRQIFAWCGLYFKLMWTGDPLENRTKQNMLFFLNTL